MSEIAASVGEIQEDQGFRWLSIPNTGAAPDPQSGVRILHRSRDGRYETSYQCWRDGVTERIPAGLEQEMFYVVEGTVACTYPSGAATQWRTGDLGYHASSVPCEIVRSDGLRMVRFRWSAPPAERAADGGLHVFGDRGPTTLYHGSPVTNHTVHASADGRVLGFYGVATEGVRFTEVPQDVEESFLVVQGSIRCTPHGGRPIVWRAGDLVYWPYDRTFDLEYSTGMGTVCIFWADQRLPNFTGSP